MSQQLKRKGNAAAPAAKQEKKAKDVAAETPSPALVQQVFDQVETIMGGALAFSSTRCFS